MALRNEKEFRVSEMEQRNFRGHGFVNDFQYGIIYRLQHEKCINLSHEFPMAVPSRPLSLTVRY